MQPPPPPLVVHTDPPKKNPGSVPATPTVQDRPCTLLHGPIGRFFDWLVITMLRRRPVQKSPYGTMEQSTWPTSHKAGEFGSHG